MPNQKYFLRFETHVRRWMKAIGDLLLEGEQLRLETDDLGPQDEIEYWKGKAGIMRLKEEIETINRYILLHSTPDAAC